ISSPIFASVTHDGGKSWTSPVQISGNLVADEASVPIVAADGSIYVAFLTSDNAVAPHFRDQYAVVKVDPPTGAKVAGPFIVANLTDGIDDYPINSDGRQTYQDSEFRTWGAGNIAADPTNANHLAVIWSDMRNSTLPAPVDPYSATTNSDIVIS